jgi:nucleotide-binding universal stress UspA family protein
MNILCATDGSDDGFEAASVFAKIIDGQRVNTIRVVLVVWPQSGTPLWDKAYAAWSSEGDDSHQAFEAVIEREVGRFKDLFQGHAAFVETAGVNGDPVDTLLHNAQGLGAGLILLAVTNDCATGAVRRLCEDIVAQSPAPVVIVNGAPCHAWGDDT